MTSGFILKKRRKNTRGRFHHKISKQNIKLIIAPLLSRVWGQYGYQKKRNSSGKSIFLVWCAVFQPKLNKLRKTAEKWLFFNDFGQFWVFFENYSILGWKTAYQTKKIEFPEEFCFFWFPCCPQTRDNSEWMKYFSFLLVWLLIRSPWDHPPTPCVIPRERGQAFTWKCTWSMHFLVTTIFKLQLT